MPKFQPGDTVIVHSLEGECAHLNGMEGTITSLFKPSVVEIDRTIIINCYRVDVGVDASYWIEQTYLRRPDRKAPPVSADTFEPGDWATIEQLTGWNPTKRMHA